MNKDPYDLTPVPQKDIFTYTDMTEEDFKNLVDNLFDKHAKKIGDHWVYEDGLDFLAAFDFARDLRAVLAAANGPLQATTSKPLPVIPWSGSNLTEMEELLQKVQQLETENAAEREKAERYRLVTLKQDAELAALREDNLKAHQMACAAGLERDRLRDELAALREALIITTERLSHYVRVPVPVAPGLYATSAEEKASLEVLVKAWQLLHPKAQP